MIWNISTIVPFITFFLYLGLLVVVMSARPQTEYRRRFRWYLLANAVYSLGSFFVLADTSNTVIWTKIFAATAIPVGISLFYFTQTIIEEKSRYARYVIYYGLVSIILTLTTNLVIIDSIVENGAITITFGSTFALIAGPSYLVVIFSIYLLIKNYRAIQDAIQRNRLLYLIIATSLLPMASLTLATELGKYPVDIAANGIAALIIAYAILRYQLLDIRLVIRQGLGIFHPYRGHRRYLFPDHHTCTEPVQSIFGFADIFPVAGSIDCLGSVGRTIQGKGPILHRSLILPRKI